MGFHMVWRSYGKHNSFLKGYSSRPRSICKILKNRLVVTWAVCPKLVLKMAGWVPGPDGQALIFCKSCKGGHFPGQTQKLFARKLPRRLFWKSESRFNT